MLQKALVRADAAANDKQHAHLFAPSSYGCGHGRTDSQLYLRARLFKQPQDDGTYYVHRCLGPAYLRHHYRGYRPGHGRQGDVGEEQPRSRRLHHQH